MIHVPFKNVKVVRHHGINYAVIPGSDETIPIFYYHSLDYFIDGSFYIYTDARHDKLYTIDIPKKLKIFEFAHYSTHIVQYALMNHFISPTEANKLGKKLTNNTYNTAYYSVYISNRNPRLYKLGCIYTKNVGEPSWILINYSSNKVFYIHDATANTLELILEYEN